MEFYGGTPPQPDAGGIGQYTVSLRPKIGLDRDQCRQARQLKHQDPELTAADIAARLGAGATEGAVTLALATLRTKNMRPTRASANITLEAMDFLRGERRERERVWQVADRLIAELVRLRAAVAALPGQSGEARGA